MLPRLVKVQEIINVRNIRTKQVDSLFHVEVELRKQKFLFQLTRTINTQVLNFPLVCFFNIYSCSKINDIPPVTMGHCSLTTCLPHFVRQETAELPGKYWYRCDKKIA